SAPVHDYGLKCRLAPVVHPFTTNNSNDIPPVKAQYFYMSPIPIDDPLSTSSIAGSADAKSGRGILRPFSQGDNNALEKAWLSLASDYYRRNHIQARRNRSLSPSLAKANAEKLDQIIHDLAIEHKEKHAREGNSQELEEPTTDSLTDPDALLPLCCPELIADVGVQIRTSFCAIARRQQRVLDRDRVAQHVMASIRTLHASASASVTDQRVPSSSIPSTHPRADSLVIEAKKGTSNPASRDERSDSPRCQETRVLSQSQLTARSSVNEANTTAPISIRPGIVDDGISGKPFVKIGTPETTQYGSSPASLPRLSTPTVENQTPEKPSAAVKPVLHSTAEMPSTLPERGRNPKRRGSIDVPVGVSRLHEVTLPALQMKPIYWSPINDLATVLRGTWFYKDTMVPVDTTVANQLEAGYRELKPHSDTWNVELKCAVEVGPLGEEKVTHQLWPKDLAPTAKTNDIIEEPLISSNPFCAAHCFQGEAAAEGTLIPSKNEDNSPKAPSQRKYEQYHVIYKNATAAFLLKPSLKPSAYHGRRPVAKILKGIIIGIPVVRGFDNEEWMRLHQRKAQTPHPTQSRSAASESQESTGRDVCAACKYEKERGQVTDLVLVAHGIGQKLAERVESYHFTHAINAFRRAINIELGNETVRSVLRDGQNGIMVLPVNWRQNLSFEEGGPMKEGDKAEYMPEGFGLKDIEPRTIPAVRGMISDIMFDIPFYMSHHKPKMIQALVNEANRVYRLWCRNNPGFSKNGRVHLIGHSLGSAMALEVLSKQPTVAPALDLSKTIQLKWFEFDTKNLFLLGSPAAFFLLLERGALIPRKGRQKPGADHADIVSCDIVGDAGLFGCLAVDNIYNILAREDPVAYLLNGTVDPKYAASLKTAYVPSSSNTLLQSMGNVFRSVVPGLGPSADQTNPALVKPSTMRLPSNLELEVHDFTREDIAEKKAYLLNDNGQIDYFLRSGGGPLELQYLNMLSAHSSYWLSADLVRMLCMEIGRKPGKANTLPAMRAMKASKR
ncbi:DDHD domain-containing protein, partial [Pseudomassariella vexata]